MVHRNNIATSRATLRFSNWAGMVVAVLQSLVKEQVEYDVSLEMSRATASLLKGSEIDIHRLEDVEQDTRLKTSRATASLLKWSETALYLLKGGDHDDRSKFLEGLGNCHGLAQDLKKGSNRRQ
jgi:hypothetical protein